LSKVKIKGNASGTGVLTIEAPNTNTDSTITLPDGDVTLGVGIDDNATSTAITIDSSENVGIGVTPESWFANQTALQIGGTGATLSSDIGAAYYSNNAYRDAAGDWKRIGSGYATRNMLYNGGHYFAVTGTSTADSAITWTTAMQIDNSGKVLAPNQLYGGNEFNFAKGLSSNLYFNYRDATITDYRMYNGNAGWATILAASFSSQSDYRLKENVVPMTGSIDRLKELKPCRFNFKTDADPMPYGQDTVDGFLAHEAQEVVPEAISGEKDAMRTEEYEVEPAVMDGETEVTPAVMGEREVEDYQGIDQSKLVPLLTSALQEAVAKIEDLEKRIEILEAK